MPGISVIGHVAPRGIRHASASLPAEARALSRMIRNIEDIELSCQVLMGVAEDALLTKIKDNLHHFALDKTEDARVVERRLALFIEQAIQILVDEAVDDDFGNSNDRAEETVFESGRVYEKKNFASDDSLVEMPNFASPEATTMATAQIVSDLSSVEETATPVLRYSKQSNQLATPAKTSKHIWAKLLESLHLAVCTRTTKVWGRKKIYEVYRLCGGPVSLEGKSCHEIANMVDVEFRNIFHGGGEDQSGCRVYCQEFENRIYVQVCVGKPFDYTDTRNRGSSGEKKKKKANEFVIVCEEGSDLMAVTASRAPSASRFTPYVLAALEIVLSAGIKAANDQQKQSAPKATTVVRVGDWSGTEPLVVLMAAHATSSANGRFENMAKTDTAHDPLVEFQDVATASLMDRTAEADRLRLGGKHDRRIAAAAVHQSRENGVAMVATNGKGTIVDHSDSFVQKRKRHRLDNLGDTANVSFQRMKWTWTGSTSATSDCWDASTGATSVSVCGIVMEGVNVMEGIRHMMDLGLTVGNDLPDYIRDATGSNITVHHGAYTISD